MENDRDVIDPIVSVSRLVSVYAYSLFSEPYRSSSTCQGLRPILSNLQERISSLNVKDTRQHLHAIYQSQSMWCNETACVDISERSFYILHDKSLSLFTLTVRQNEHST